MAQQATSPKEGPVAHALPPLQYASDALEPYIDKMTMEIHHGKHHNAYVTNLNKALEGHADLQALSIDQLLSSLDRVPEAIRTAVRNNGGGHWNHSMFWKIMKKGGGSEPAGPLGNSGLGRGTAGHARITGLLHRLAASPDPVVGESARWGLSRIQSGQEIASARSL